MGKIEKLTPEQEAQIPIWYDRWYKIGTYCEPADRPNAEAAVIGMLKEAGQYNNQKIVWCDSWMVAELLQNILKNEVLQASLQVSLQDSLEASLEAPLWASLGDSLEASLWDSLGDSLQASLRASLGDSLRASLWDSLGDSLRDSLWDSLWDPLRESLQDSLWASLRDSLWASLRASLGDSLRYKQLKYYGTWFDGQLDSYWVCFYLFCRDVLGVKYDDKRNCQLDMHAQLCQSANRVYFYEKQVLICERPCEIHFKGAMLHHDGGMSVKFRDGWGIWSLNGVRVPQEIAETPAESLNPELVLTKKNAEIRREIVRKIGVERVCQKLNATVIDRWGDGMYELLELPVHDEKYTYLKMRNPSTGTYHIEGVEGCRTVGEALQYRKPDKMKKIPVSADGEDYYQQGDVVIWPRNAKSLKPYPAVLT